MIEVLGEEILEGLLRGARFLANTVVFRVHTLVLPLVEDFPQACIRLRVLPLVVSAFLPVCEYLTMFLQHLLKGGITGKVPYFMWVLLKVVEFLPGSGAEEELINKRGQGACLMSFAEKDGVVPVVPILGL